MQTLPAAFSDLQPFVEQWALKGQRARYQRMIDQGIDELTDFYNAMLPRAEAIIEYLNTFPLDNMPAPEQTLFDLALTFAETAHPVDFGWKATEFEDVFPFDRVDLKSASEAW